VSKKPRRRTDYWDDPRAPAATSRKPSASVVLRNHRGELLLLRRAGSGLWTIPTGALKKKETATACAIRECREETGLDVELTGLVGVFSDPRHRIAYPDGEVRVPVNVCFYGQPVSGELATDSESDEAAWVALEDLDEYDIHPAIRRRICHALNGTVPHVDLTAAGREAGMGWGGSGVSGPCLAVPGSPETILHSTRPQRVGLFHRSANFDEPDIAKPARRSASAPAGSTHQATPRHLPPVAHLCRRLTNTKFEETATKPA